MLLCGVFVCIGSFIIALLAVLSVSPFGDSILQVKIFVVADSSSTIGWVIKYNCVCCDIT